MKRYNIKELARLSKKTKLKHKPILRNLHIDGQVMTWTNSYYLLRDYRYANQVEQTFLLNPNTLELSRENLHQYPNPDMLVDPKRYHYFDYELTIHNNKIFYHEKDNDMYALDQEILDQMNKILGLKKDKVITADSLLINKSQVMYQGTDVVLVAMLKRID